MAMLLLSVYMQKLNLIGIVEAAKLLRYIISCKLIGTAGAITAGGGTTTGGGRGALRMGSSSQELSVVSSESLISFGLERSIASLGQLHTNASECSHSASQTNQKAIPK